MPECSLIPKSYSLFPYIITFCNFNPYLLFKFIFLIILVYLLFIHAKHSPTKLYQCTCTVLLYPSVIDKIDNYITIYKEKIIIIIVIIINQSIHINLSAGT